MKEPTKAVLVFVIVTVGSYILMTAYSGCEKRNPDIKPVILSSARTEEPVVPASVVVPVPSASAAPVVSGPQPVRSLAMFACFKNGERWAVIDSLENHIGRRETWTLSDPYSLKIANEVDCGFFPTLMESGWRTAFCLEDGKRRAFKRLYIYTQDDTVGFRIGADEKPGFKETKCPLGT